MSSNKFEYYEIVKINPKSGVLDLSSLDTRKFDYQVLVGRIGVIMAMAECDNGAWLYEVSLDEANDAYTIREDDLQSTGQYKKRSDFYSDDTVKVVVDPKTAEGSLKEGD